MLPTPKTTEAQFRHDGIDRAFQIFVALLQAEDDAISIAPSRRQKLIEVSHELRHEFDQYGIAGNFFKSYDDFK